MSIRSALLLGALVLLGATHAAIASDKPARTGGWRLGLESSPYLRMHADNPVEWYAWGDEAFEKAKKENKPLFISIGYFTCHWCHVMERESFRNPEIAKWLNDHFVSIKIDREQRPDIDAAYMSFVQMTTGRGGWPMTVWATPDRHPFLGGTYFPPRAKYGRKGMLEILPQILDRWQKDKDSIIELSTRAVKSLNKSELYAGALQQFSNELLVEAQEQYLDQYDEFYGGFGAAPKFPQPGRLLFLLSDKNKKGQSMALATLDHMAAGGIYDHLAGGFHRYATDPEWRIPHFEKMLYDQALIVQPYLLAFQQTGKEHYANVVRQVLDFSLTRMRHEQGGFFSALSADSKAEINSTEAHEGTYYVWGRDAWRAALKDPELRAWGAARYGVTEHGNVSSGELSGSNILYVNQTIPALAKRFSVSEKEAKEKIAEVDAALLVARAARPAVPIDDKVVTEWNGYMITSLARASQLLKEPRYLQAAIETANFIVNDLYDSGKSTLYRDWRNGTRGAPGFAEDYGGMIGALLELHSVTGEKVWLKKATELTEIQIDTFWDNKNSGFYSTPENTELWIRKKKASDGVTPSANSVAISNLLRIAEATKKPEYANRAVQAARWVGGAMKHVPYAMSYTLIEWPSLIKKERNKLENGR